MSANFEIAVGLRLLPTEALRRLQACREELVGGLKSRQVRWASDWTQIVPEDYDYRREQNIFDYRFDDLLYIKKLRAWAPPANVVGLPTTEFGRRYKHIVNKIFTVIPFVVVARQPRQQVKVVEHGFLLMGSPAVAPRLTLKRSHKKLRDYADLM